MRLFLLALTYTDETWDLQLPPNLHILESKEKVIGFSSQTLSEFLKGRISTVPPVFFKLKEVIFDNHRYTPPQNEPDIEASSIEDLTVFHALEEVCYLSFIPLYNMFNNYTMKQKKSCAL